MLLMYIDRVTAEATGNLDRLDGVRPAVPDATHRLRILATGSGVVPTGTKYARERWWAHVPDKLLGAESTSEGSMLVSAGQPQSTGPHGLGIQS
jgi:hypothetical protein